ACVFCRSGFVPWWTSPFLSVRAELTAKGRLAAAMDQTVDQDGEGLARAFFTGANAPLLAELRKKTDAEQEREALREAVGLKDETFLRRLQALGVRPEAAV